MARKKSVTFNHTSNTLLEEEVEMLRTLYRNNDKKMRYYQKAWKRYKRISLAMKIGVVLLGSAGLIGGGVIMNPIMFGAVTGTSLALSVVGELKNYKRKTEMTWFAWPKFNKLLIEIKAFMYGAGWGANVRREFLARLSWEDEKIIDLCPDVSVWGPKYQKVFSSE